MDLSKAISYNGLTISGVTRSSGGLPAYGMQIERANFSDAEVTSYVDKSALQDGVDVGDVYLGRRVLNIRASVFGTSQGDAWDRLADFLAAFNPRLAYNADTANLGFLPFDFYQPTADIATWATSAYPNGIPLRFYCRPAALPTWEVLRDSTGGAASGGLAFDVSVPLVMRDPRKYLQTAQTLTVTGSSQSATYRGNYPTWGTITITKTSAAGPSNFTVVLSGQTSVFDLSSAGGLGYTIDYERKLFYLTSSGASRMSWVTTGINGDEIDPDGSTTISMANSTGLTVTLSYREAFA